MSNIYLSPRQILSYLKDLEAKVPVSNPVAYVPTDQNCFASEKDLDREAKHILEYVGLPHCVPACKFQRIDGNYAGYTVNDRSVHAIPITVNEEYRNNISACRAILAHEICHKVIYLHGIDFQKPAPQEYNEIFTDLCTIYVGLGELVLAGYIDAGTRVLKMGYLKADMYRQAFNIVAKATGRYGYKGDTDMNDPLLEEALAIWTTPGKMREALQKNFLKNEEAIAEVNRNILLLRQILDQVYTRHGDMLRKLSDDSVALGVFGGKSVEKPFALFSGIYEGLVGNGGKAVFSPAQTDIFNLILSLTSEYKDIDIGALDYTMLRCPACGRTSKTNIFDRDTIVKCPSCGLYFRFCNSLLNITRMRQMHAEVMAGKQREKDAIDKGKSEIARDRLKLDVQRKADERYKEQYREQCREQYRQKYRNVVDSIPRWLKLLIGKRLPEEL